MSNITTQQPSVIQPIPGSIGLPPDAVAILNDRFRRVSAISQSNAQQPNTLVVAHPQRASKMASAYALGYILIESDRGYQYYSAGKVWKYLSGVSVGASPWSDLGANDTGALYVTTGSPYTIKVWTGTAWQLL